REAYIKRDMMIMCYASVRKCTWYASFSFYTNVPIADLHSFPTRRSSDLGEPDALKGARPVRKGIERKGLATIPRSQSTLRASRDVVFVYATKLVRNWRDILGSSHLPKAERQRGP